ncbi:unnamed protein product, partial [Durusdinium trenchii]
VLEIGVADEEPAAWEVEGEEAVAGTHGQPAEAEEAENLIGLDEAAKNDPLKHYVVVQNQIRRLQEDQARIERQELEVRKGNSKSLQRCAWWYPEKSVMDTRWNFGKCVGDSQQLLKPNYKRWKAPEIVSPKFWWFRAGTCYPCFFPSRGVFTEFFYGDCLPFEQSRPVRLPAQTVTACMLQREELESSIDDDANPY